MRGRGGAREIVGIIITVKFSDWMGPSFGNRDWKNS